MLTVICQSLTNLCIHKAFATSIIAFTITVTEHHLPFSPQGVCHRDLKLENTLLDGNPAPRLKICDFGYSKVCVDTTDINAVHHLHLEVTPQQSHTWRKSLSSIASARRFCTLGILCIKDLGNSPYALVAPCERIRQPG